MTPGAVVIEKGQSALKDRPHSELARLKPRELREAIRRGEWTQRMHGLGVGYTMSNLAILPSEFAYDFLLFCQRNPLPCPVMEVTDAGSPVPRQYAPGADLRTDLPRYRVFEHGQMVDEPTDITKYWRSDFVAFLLGCNLTCTGAMERAGVPMTTSVLYVSNIACRPAGRFSGPVIVSMRRVPREKITRAVQVTSRFPNTHGAPIHIGDPAAIGIDDMGKPWFGIPPKFASDEVPVFWACGVTPQSAALEARLPIMITHAPGHMFVTDALDEETAVL
jgi:uncharacterized protein YcsI (UPF0317 family)